ncbi:MAG: hypothetical protein A2043_11325 [Candidatus Schekmanbacteria bacterium GWA2_38_9]|nr:MAG: hypothetical protein A2043_11325 [Candidatus Schekmanbacteria bacterium GWA2_38_9]
MTDTDGGYSIAVPAGNYNVIIQKLQYDPFASDNVVVSNDSVLLNAAISPTTLTISVGSISGRVTDSGGNPIEGATVQISGGLQTNGVFASTITNSDGSYTIDSIPLKDTNGAQITSYTAKAVKKGYGISEILPVVAENKNTANVDFILSSASTFTTYFEDDFEEDTGWVAYPDLGVFWHRVQNGSGIVNTLIPEFVTLSPNDTSNGAIPNAFSGQYLYWFGRDIVGSYLGVQDDTDSIKSGGTSTIPHSGTLTSPEIDLASAINPVLRFWSWWEIEGANPNDTGFDLMTVEILTDGGETFAELIKLNPYSDPVVENRNDKPYTSAGFFKAPVWTFYEANLSEYVGQYVMLRFRFDTVDSMYNGFRGWFIDKLSVEEIPLD